MPSEIIVRHCSPTLAGMKIGNLFGYIYENENQLANELDEWNKKLNNKGIYFITLKSQDNRALIYVYRKKMLERELFRSEIIDFLSNSGYLTDSVENCILCLKNKLSKENGFPHEIGVFLGYPITDIKAFIENGGANYKCVGCWKVYSDEYEAQKTFAKYKRCTDVFCQKVADGFDITRLTVAV